MRQELGLDRQSGAFALSDRLTQTHGIPVDDDGRKEIEPCHAVVLAFGGAVSGAQDFTLASDTQRVLQSMMGLALVGPCVRAERCTVYKGASSWRQR